MGVKLKSLSALLVLSLFGLLDAWLSGGGAARAGGGAGAGAPGRGPSLPPLLGSGAINALTEPVGYQCPLPPGLDVAASPGCAKGGGYPACRWQVPPEKRAGGLYRVWWRTPPAQLWGGRRLVTLLVSSVALFSRWHPGEEVYVGDVDSPPGAHVSHGAGVDADLYLPRWMEWTELEGAVLADNMSWRSEASKEEARGKVAALARALVTCAGGSVRIFYNDPLVAGPVNDWWSSMGYASPFGPPVQAHNATHRNHFHVRVEP